jgi:hypothetical protein
VFINKNMAKDFDRRISELDVSLFDKIMSQTSKRDKASLLAAENAVRNIKKKYVYLEIGSYLGGSLQPYLLDVRCAKIISIDKRPESPPDNRFKEGYTYENNSTQTMLNNLKKVSTKNLSKIKCFDNDATEISKDKLNIKVDLAFIDGEHTDKAVVSDFNVCKSLLKSDAVVLFHDYTIVHKGIELIIKELRKENAKFSSYVLPDNIFVIEFRDSKMHADKNISALRINNLGLFLIYKRLTKLYYICRNIFKRSR